HQGIFDGRGQVELRNLQLHPPSFDLRKDRDSHQRAVAAELLGFSILVFLILQDIMDLYGSTLERHPSRNTSTSRWKRMLLVELIQFTRNPKFGDGTEELPIPFPDHAAIGRAHPRRVFNKAAEHGRQVNPGTADASEDLGGGCLLL